MQILSKPGSLLLGQVIHPSDCGGPPLNLLHFVITCPRVPKLVVDTVPGLQQGRIILVRIEQLSSRLKHALAKPKAWLHKAFLLPKSLLKGQI